MITDSDIKWCQKYRAKIQFYDAYGDSRVEVSIPGGAIVKREKVENAILELRKYADMEPAELSLVNLLKFYVEREDYTDSHALDIAKDALYKLTGNHCEGDS
jgi:hypothetical protein